tara:strand:- start:61 stop:429 length:369 start_codon:yes stop_codon:yes gene_type:complete
MPKSETREEVSKNGKHWGKPWRIVAKCDTFEEADELRNAIVGDPTMQVKVHYQGPRNHKTYNVKSRLLIDSAPEIAKKAFQPEGTKPNEKKVKTKKGTKRQQTKMKQQARKIREEAEEKANG